MLVGGADQLGDAVDVAGELVHAISEGMGDEAHLVETVGEPADGGDVGDLHVAVGAARGLDEAVGAGAGAHDEAIVGAWQADVELGALAAESHLLGAVVQRLAQHRLGQANLHGLAAGRGAGTQHRLAGALVDDGDAVSGEQVVGAVDDGGACFLAAQLEARPGSRRGLDEGACRSW